MTLNIYWYMGFASFILLSGAVVFLVFVWPLLKQGPRVKLAVTEANASPPHEFELRYRPDGAGPFRLASRVERNGRLVGQSSAPHVRAPVICRYQVSVDGEQKAQETLGIGGVRNHPVDRQVTLSFNSSASSLGGGRGHARATYVLSDLPECPSGSELLITGSFEGLDGTELDGIEVFVTR